MPHKKHKKAFKKKGKKLAKLVHKDHKDSHLSYTSLRASKKMMKLHLPLPERYFTRQRTFITFGVAGAIALQNHNFVVQTNPILPAGINAAAASGPPSLSFFLNNNAGNIVNTGQSVAQITGLNATGTVPLAAIYQTYKCYASQIKVRVTSGSLLDQMRLSVVPVVGSTTVVNTYQTAGLTTLPNFWENIYVRSKDITPYQSSGKQAQIQHFMKTNEIIGVSRDEYMNNKIYNFQNNTNQPPQLLVANIVDCQQLFWQVNVQARDGINFTSTICYEIELEHYVSWDTLVNTGT